MLNKDIFKANMQKLIDLFPNWPIKYDDRKTMETWYYYFKNIDTRLFEKGIERFIKEESFYPTVAGLLKYMKDTSQNYTHYNELGDD